MNKKTKLKEALKVEIRKVLNEDIESNSVVSELARVANTIKISNLKAAEAYRDANKGKWFSDMVDQVIKAGDKGITQVDLATAIGKGSQQTINPKVRELLAAGVFSQGTADIKSEPLEKPKSEPKIKALPPKSDADSEDIEVVDKDEDLDIDVEDDYEKKDEDDEDEDEDDLAKKASPNKGVQTKSKQLDSVIKQMKDLAKEFKAAKEAEDKEKQSEITAKLKDLNKQKSTLEKEVYQSLGDEDDEE